MAGPLTQTLSNVAGAVTDPEFWSDIGSNATNFLTPESAPTTPGLPTPEQLSAMPWSELLQLRKHPSLLQQDQNYIGPFEHRAYTRENSATPSSAATNALMTLGYTPYKALGLGSARSQPSWSEIGQGLHGVWEGLTR